MGNLLLILAIAIVVLAIVVVLGFVVIRLRRDRLASEERMLKEARETCLEEQARDLELRYDCLEAVREGHPEAANLVPQEPAHNLELRGK